MTQAPSLPFTCRKAPASGSGGVVVTNIASSSDGSITAAAVGVVIERDSFRSAHKKS